MNLRNDHLLLPHAKNLLKVTNITNNMILSQNNWLIKHLSLTFCVSDMGQHYGLWEEDNTSFQQLPSTVTC